MHTERTQYAHKQTNNMQHTEDNTEHSTEQKKDTQNTCTTSTQYPGTERTQNSAHNYRTYSFDLYHEQIYIKNSDTIELYTISK